MQFKDISAVLGTWVGIVSAIIGGYFAIQSYNADIAQRREADAKRVDERVQAAFAMVDRFNESDFVPMRSRLVRSFETGANCNNFLGDTSPIPRQEVYTIVEYFDRANACVERGLCDGDTVKQLLGPYATWWAPALEDHIQTTRQQDAGIPGSERYGAGLQALATPTQATHRMRCSR